MRIGFTCGSFDLLHAGHYLMFRECKKVCDYLIVGLLIDPSIDRPDKNKPIQSLVERQIQLAGCRYVDEIIVYQSEKELEEILAALDIDVRIRGADHLTGFNTAQEICQRRGILPYFTKRDHNYSTSNLRERIKKA